MDASPRTGMPAKRNPPCRFETHRGAPRPLKSRTPWKAVLICACLVSACATQPGAFIRHVDFGPEDTVANDVRTRLATRVKPGVNSQFGFIDPLTITCVEPSPDVAVAVASSFGAGISILGEGAGSLSAQQVEGLAQLAERTTAIQALLKQGYQACLDYANGAISRTTYSLRAARLDDLMVTMVLAEDASGAFGRKGGAIATQASAEASAKVAGFPEALKNMDQAKKDLDAADQKVREKQAALETAEAAIKNAPTGTDTKPLIATRDAAKAELDAATVQRDALSNRLTSMADTMSKAAGEVKEAIGVGGLSPVPDAQTASVIEKMQSNFLEKDVEQAFVSTCMTEMGLSTDPHSLSEHGKLQSAALGAATKPDRNGALNRDRIETFLVAEAPTKRTELYNFCQDNLAGFLQAAVRNRQELKLKALEVEAKRIDAVTQAGYSPNASPFDTIYVMASFTVAKNRTAALTAKYTDLAKATITAASPTFSAADRNKLIKDQTDLTGRAKTLLDIANAAMATGEETATKALDSQLGDIMGDPARYGTAEERRTWQSRFEQQQAIARAKDRYFKNLTGDVNATAEAVAQMIDRIANSK